MNGSSQESEPSAIKRMYTKPRRSAAWEEVTPPVVRFLDGRQRLLGISFPSSDGQSVFRRGWRLRTLR